MKKLMAFCVALFIIVFILPNFIYGMEGGDAILAGVASIAFSSDGKFLAGGGDDNAVHIWDVKTGKEVRTMRWQMDPSGPYSSYSLVYASASVTFSPDDKYLASTGGSPIVIWDVNTGKEVWVLRPNGIADTVAFSPDGKYLAAASSRDTVQFWDIKTGKVARVLKGDGTIHSISFSLDGNYLVAGGSKHIYSDDSPQKWKGLIGAIKLWNVKTGKEIWSVGSEGGIAREVTSVAFSPDGKFIASGDGGPILFWDVKSGKAVKPFKGNGANPDSFVFSADGKYLAGAIGNRTVLWNFKTGEEIRTFKGHKYGTTSLAFSPDGKYLASSGMDQVYSYRDGDLYADWKGDDFIIHLWDIETGKEAIEIKGNFLFP
jgi:WD40 repeat protein